MNLTHLFNKNFFFENIKKSKSSIICASILLPIFSFLGMMISNSIETSFVMQYGVLELSNIIFMYIVPVVLSITLFSFVYKKNSADMVFSLPISRTSIFATNTIGGITIILLIQLVTALVLQITSLFSTNIIVFSTMIWEGFLYFSIAYIFVFVVCNLAMSFSGNMFATIASAMLIVFLIPFILLCSRAFPMIDSELYSVQDDANQVVVYDSYDFTAPSYLFDIMVNSVDFTYNVPSIIKMIVLSILYIGIGTLLFKRKKVEMAEESYESDNAHLIIKFLTLTPFFAYAVLDKVYTSPVGLCFFIAVLGLYFYLFDVITKKRIKFVKSICCFIIFSVLMYAIFSLIVPNLRFIGRNAYNLNTDVSKIEIESLPNNIKIKLIIDDPTIIRSIMNSSNSYTSFSSTKQPWNTNIKIITQNGKEFYFDKDIWSNEDKILKKYGNEKVNYSLDNELLVLFEKPLTKKEQQDLKDILNEELGNLTYRELFKKARDYNYAFELSAVSYKNHVVNTNFLSFLCSNRSSDYIAKLINNNAYKYYNNETYLNMHTINDFEDYIVEKNPQIDFGYDYYEPKTYEKNDSGEDYYYYDNYINVTDIIYSGINCLNKDDYREYLANHKDDTFDITKPYYSVNMIGFAAKQTYFYSNDLEGFYNMFAKSYNEALSEDTGIVLNIQG